MADVIKFIHTATINNSFFLCANIAKDSLLVIIGAEIIPDLYKHIVILIQVHRTECQINAHLLFRINHQLLMSCVSISSIGNGKHQIINTFLLFSRSPWKYISNYWNSKRIIRRIKNQVVSVRIIGSQSILPFFINHKNKTAVRVEGEIGRIVACAACED